MNTSIAEVINRTRRRLGLEHTTMHEAYLRELVNEGVSELGVLENYIVSCEIIDIECGKGTLPEFCDQVIAIAPVRNSSGSCCLCSGEAQLQALSVLNTRTCSCLPYYVSDSSILLEMSNCGGSCGSSTNIYYTQNGQLILRSSAEGRMKIFYSGKNVDSDGVMYIDADYMRGVSAYAAYQFAKSGANFNKYPYRLIKDWEVEWVAQKINKKSISQKKYTKANKARFAAIANAIVTSPELALVPNP